MMNEHEFINQMIKFYHACNVPAAEVDHILATNRDQISRYLVATPELMARKFYEWTFNKSIN
ncbi:MAG: hypothetical protein ACLRX6_03735 [Limosilactobacillus pontis]|uniref:Uncharacterized protein n=1 Tax=Limosilactobacillus pontis TaxID=35787 RepID=A0A2J6NPN1_9LACO|nr:hypothetical protein [Limosilactobacillus pontis]PMB83263.1 hypothetical protein CK797_00220 [Limosilactobacillus pontis]